MKNFRRDAEWRERLTPAQYRVTVLGEDDADFDNAYWDHFAPGTYHCVRCAAPLFASEAKYEANTGAPSFSQAIGENVVVVPDPRPGHGDEQLQCAACNSKLGHLHHDGPPPFGRRYCTNSTAFRFEPR